VSSGIPRQVFEDQNGVRLSDEQAIANFERWMQDAHPDRPFTPGTTEIDWSNASERGGPTLNAEWLDPKGDPLLPRVGEFGYVAPMEDQPRAEYLDRNDPSTRLTENEHATPHAQNAAVEPGYDEAAYRADATVLNPRNVALDKTRVDNQRSEDIVQRVEDGKAVNITDDIDMPSNANFHRANEAARAAGEPHIENPGSIDRGTLEQIHGRWERGGGTTINGPQQESDWEPEIEEWDAPRPSGPGKDQ